MKTSTLVILLLVVVVVILIPHIQAQYYAKDFFADYFYGGEIPKGRVPTLIQIDRAEMPRERGPIRKQPKIHCSGFSCVYTHLSYTGKSEQAKLREFLRACAMDPDCSLTKIIESRSRSSL